MKLGLKRVDEWLEKGNGNPVRDTRSDHVVRVKVEPFELYLNGETRKVEQIDFFLNSKAEIIFTKQLENNELFALRWEKEEEGEGIGFATNRPNVLVIYTNLLELNNHERYGKTRQTEDIEINWKDIMVVDSGARVGEEKYDSFVFDISPQTYSINGKNLTFNQVFWFPRLWGLDKVTKEKVSEWKTAQKPLILKKVNIGNNDWFSVEAGNYLVVSDYEDSNLEGSIRQKRMENVREEILETVPGWEKLSSEQKNKFRKELKNKNFRDLKSEIEAAIKNLGSNNDEPKPNQNSPVNNKAGISKELKIFLWVGGMIFTLLLTFLIYRKLSKKTKKK